MRGHRPDGAGVHQAQPLARRHRRRGAHPADARAAPRSTSRRPARSSSPSRTPSAPCTPPTARCRPSAPTCCCRGGHRHAAGARRPRRRRVRSTGRASSATTTSSATHLPRRARVRATSTEQVRSRGGFVLPNGPRDSRTFPTATGKAMLTVNELEPVECPPGRLILQTHPLARPVQHHHLQPQRPLPRHQEGPRRGVRQPRGPRRARASPTATASTSTASGRASPTGRCRGYRVVAYPTARGCAAAYFPEANVLVPLASTALGSNTPVSKAVIVRLEKVA